MRIPATKDLRGTQQTFWARPRSHYGNHGRRAGNIERVWCDERLRLVLATSSSSNKVTKALDQIDAIGEGYSLESCMDR
jgi:hypothetical protein